MTVLTDGPKKRVRRRSRGLLIALTIYGVLYLILFGPDLAYSGLSVPGLLFLLFLVGYLIVWKNEGIGGAVFILWYVAWWGLGPLIIASEHKDSFYLGVMLGFPLLILGILFGARWYKRRGAEA
jgi:hypothetical protein